MQAPFKLNARLFAGVCLVLVTGFASPGMSAEPWSRFRGPGGQGRHNGPLPVKWSASENVVWKTELPGPGGSSPIVFGDRIFLTSYSGYAVPGVPGGDLSALTRHVVCLQRADGKTLWKKDVPAAQPEQAKVRDHGYASSTPLADADRLYVFMGRSGVFAYNHDGKELWRADVGSGTHGWGSAASPVLYKDLIIINASVESSALIALNKATGKEVWRAAGMKESWNTPILVPVAGGKEELVVAILGKVLGLDPATGEKLWSCATDIGWYMVPSLVHDKDVIYCIGGRTGGGLAVRAGGRGDVTASHRLWTLKKGSNVSSPVLHEGHLYILHENLGMAVCVEAATGRVVYEERIPGAGQFYASTLLADGKLYGVARRGGVFVVAAKPQFEFLGRNELGDRSSFDASPAADGSRLLIRSDKFLYAIGAK
jgi:outer membrane protein assembly factor BamB